MNATLYQLRWDLRRIRVLWIIWIVLLIGGALLYPHFATLGRASQLGGAARLLTSYLLALLIVARFMYATPFAGPNAFWKTLPLRQSSLFWTKTLLLVAFIEIPLVLAQVVSWRTLDLEGAALIWPLLHYTLLTSAIFVGAAFWASLCERLASFAMAMACSVGFLALCAVVFHQVASLSDRLPIGVASGRGYDPDAMASTLIAMIALTCGTALLAWFLAGLLRQRALAVLALAAGLALAATANNLWRVEFLRPAPVELDSVSVEHRLLTGSEETPDGFLRLWNQVAVKLPERQSAQPVSWSAWITGATQSSQSSEVSSWGRWESLHHTRLAPFFPEGTRLVSTRQVEHSLLSNHNLIGQPCRVRANTRLTIYEWRQRAILPLTPGAQHPRPGGGGYRVHRIAGDLLEVIETTPAETFTPAYVAPHTHPDAAEAQLALVLHREGADRALVLEQRGYSGTRSSSLSLAHRRLNLEVPAGHLRALAGVDRLEDVDQPLRLYVFEAIPVATTEVTIDEDSWTAFATPDLPDPDSTPTPGELPSTLSANSTDAEVDSYLDEVLFGLPDNLDRNDWNRLDEQLEPVARDHFDRLLARLPVGEYAEYIVRRVLRKHATRDHLPALLEALQRDPGLASLFLELGWEADAAPILAERLRDHIPLDDQSGASSVRIVATMRDPGTYDDLRWHFLQTRSGHRSMIASLAQCPGFPIQETLQELWNMVRFEDSWRSRDVAVLAARLGDREALRLALVRYLSDPREQDLNLLGEAVGRAANPDLPAWVHEHFDNLEFDPASRTFRLP